MSCESSTPATLGRAYRIAQWVATSLWTNWPVVDNSALNAHRRLPWPLNQAR
jgi:hypothetical protein